MTYSILENYSCLNSYNYTDKNAVISTLDWLSTPSRRVLGGRDICILSQRTYPEMSTPSKVATAFFSLVFFPIAIISAGSLILKSVLVFCIGEKTKLTTQTENVWKTIDEFRLQYEANNYTAALACLSQNREIHQREDVYGQLNSILNNLITNNSAWESISPWINLVNTTDRGIINSGIIKRLNYEYTQPNWWNTVRPWVSLLNNSIDTIDDLVSKKLSQEFNGFDWLTGADIKEFVDNSIRNKSLENKSECYKKLCSSALRVVQNEDPLLSAIKMVLADGLIQYIINAKMQQATSTIDNQMIALEESMLRFSVSIMPDFTDSVKLSNLRTAIQEIRQEQKKLQKLNEHHPETFQKLREYLVTSMSNSTLDSQREWFGMLLNIADQALEVITLIENSSSEKEVSQLENEYTLRMSEIPQEKIPPLNSRMFTSCYIRKREIFIQRQMKIIVLFSKSFDKMLSETVAKKLAELQQKASA